MYLLSGAMSLHHLAIMTKPSLSCLLCFLCMLYIPLFKIRRIFDLLVSPPFLILFRQVATRVYMYNYYPKPAHLPLLHPCPHCSSTVRFVIVKLIWPVLSVCILLLLHIEHHYCDDCIQVIRVRSCYHFTKIRCSTPSSF